MKIVRTIGSVAFVAGLFTAVFAGVPWYTFTSTDPVVPWWLRIAVLCLFGGILVVMATVGIEQMTEKKPAKTTEAIETETGIMLSNSTELPGKAESEVLGMVQGHTVYAIWLGNDLSALIRLILGGELVEYTEMMGKARAMATGRMTAKAAEMGADAIINVRYMTTSVVGSAAELLAYGTAVKLRK